MTFWKWSRTAASNGTADSTCLFPEGMAPSAINDGTRGMMAAAAKYRDDMSGAIVTGGSVNAYTVSSYEGYDTLAHLDGMAIAFSPHVTSTGAVTVNIDGLGAKPYRPSPGVDFIGGELIQGTPYVGVYNNAAGEIYARGFMSSPYSVPLLGGMDFWDTIAPNSCFVFPQGQAISRTVYAKAFARWGVTYGAGDGSTTFNVPDKTGRVSAMKEAVAMRLTTAKVGVDGATMGAAGGGSQTLVLANLPPYTPAGTITNGAITMNGLYGGTSAGATTGGAQGTPISPVLINVTSQAASTFAGTPQGGTSTPVNVAQPTIVCNYIIRII